jgi:hypothetical protein
MKSVVRKAARNRGLHSNRTKMEVSDFACQQSCSEGVRAVLTHRLGDISKSKKMSKAIPVTGLGGP